MRVTIVGLGSTMGRYYISNKQKNQRRPKIKINNSSLTLFWLYPDEFHVTDLILIFCIKGNYYFVIYVY